MMEDVTSSTEEDAATGDADLREPDELKLTDNEVDRQFEMLRNVEGQFQFEIYTDASAVMRAFHCLPKEARVFPDMASQRTERNLRADRYRSAQNRLIDMVQTGYATKALLLLLAPSVGHFKDCPGHVSFGSEFRA